MLRKLLSVGLCSAGILASVGAGEAQASEAESYMPNYTPAGYVPVDYLPSKGVSLASSVNMGSVAEDTTTTVEEGLSTFVSASTATVEQTAEEEETELEVEVDVVLEGVDHLLLVNGVPVSENVSRSVVNGVTYVSLLDMAKELDENAICSWSPNSKTAQVHSDYLNLTAVGGQCYVEANGRYLYVAEGLYADDNAIYVPLTTLARAFDAEVFWNDTNDVTTVATGTGGIMSGDRYYNADDLFWLSRVVYAESGNQPLDGQMGVAMVVLNRVERSAYPNTILGVISQANQFSVYQNGALANRTPTEISIIAAKLVMDGGEVAILKNATHFDSLSVSWASRNLTKLTKIGGHTFYG